MSTSTINTTAVVVGAGQAGLAMSAELSRHGIDHVVLDRGRIAERWHSERWDSLQLLTPNWMTRLPGFSYRGPDLDGFMTMPQVQRFFQQYATAIRAPVLEETTVFSARSTERGYHLVTSSGTIDCRILVAATGACATPNIPAMAATLPDHVHQTSPKFYRRPSQLPDGGVLVVGASASGIQLAREIHQSGRPVTLAVGDHTRLPRRYRGLDIHRWLDLMGALERPHDTLADVEAARREPSLQLVGSDSGRSIDLDELQRIGVRLAGRVTGGDRRSVRFGDNLAAAMTDADRRQRRLLDRIDTWADTNGLAREVDAPDRPAPIGAVRTVDEIDAAGLSTVLWATGYRPDFSWLDLPVVRADGSIDHDGGVVRGSAGLYLMGMPVMRTRKSTFIDGVGADAEALAGDIADCLGIGRRAVDSTVAV